MHEVSVLRARVGVASAFVFSVAMFASTRAQARDRDADGEPDRDTHFTLAVDFDYASTFRDDLIEKGGGGALRVGSEHDLFLVTLIPEASFDMHSFGARTRSDAKLVTGKLGGRLRFFKIVEPGIFAHVGIGNISGDSTYEHTGVAMDMGVSVDLTILPLIDLGLHAAWNRIFGGRQSGVSYGTSGLHAALVF